MFGGDEVAGYPMRLPRWPPPKGYGRPLRAAGVCRAAGKLSWRSAPLHVVRYIPFTQRNCPAMMLRAGQRVSKGCKGAVVRPLCAVLAGGPGAGARLIEELGTSGSFGVYPRESAKFTPLAEPLGVFCCGLGAWAGRIVAGAGSWKAPWAAGGGRCTNWLLAAFPGVAGLFSFLTKYWPGRYWRFWLLLPFQS